MVPFGSRRGEAGSLTVYLMVGAFLFAGGFFFWLSVRSTPVEVEVVEGNDAPEEAPATIVALDAFGANPMAYVASVSELRGLGVGTRLGAEAFLLLGIPNQPSGYLVRIAPEVVPIGGDVEFGATVTVTGTVYARTDSVIDAWVASGGIDESQRVIAQFAESFLEARAVSVTAPPQPDPN
jgi:hypothetical protein